MENKTLFLAVQWTEHKATHSTDVWRALYPHSVYVCMTLCLNKGYTLPVITCITRLTKYHCSRKYVANYMVYSWKANRSSFDKDIFCLLWTWRFITIFATAHHYQRNTMHTPWTLFQYCFSSMPVLRRHLVFSYSH